MISFFTVFPLAVTRGPGHRVAAEIEASVEIYEIRASLASTQDEPTG